MLIMVYNIEKYIVHSCMFMARYRTAVQPMGFKWPLILIGGMFGFHIAAWALGEPDLVWGSRAIVGFMLFSFAYDIMYQRVMRGPSGRESWR